MLQQLLSVPVILKNLFISKLEVLVIFSSGLLMKRVVPDDNKAPPPRRPVLTYLPALYFSRFGYCLLFGIIT